MTKQKSDKLSNLLWPLVLFVILIFNTLKLAFCVAQANEIGLVAMYKEPILMETIGLYICDIIVMLAFVAMVLAFRKLSKVCKQLQSIVEAYQKRDKESLEKCENFGQNVSPIK